jgi:MFS family permease
VTRTEAGAARSGPQGRWLAIGAINLAYLVVTIAESLLAPLLPVVAADLGFDMRHAGLAFALLTGSIAVGTFGGGYVLARRGARAGALGGAAVVAAGTVLVASSVGPAPFLAGHALIGLGTGLFFPSGMNAIGVLSGPGRRGLAMGVFGVAFSAGLTVAALLAAVGAQYGWRVAFWVTAGLAGASFLVTLVAPLPPLRTGPPGGARKRLRDALGVPVMVGGVGAWSQYGTVAFLPAFAVTAWGLSPAAAALMLAAGRVLSVPAKLIAGTATDRYGGRATVYGVGVVLVVTGLWWTLVPGPWPALWAAIVFAAAVSAVFPVANVLAFESFGDRGPLLGTYRAVQLSVGAAGGAAIGFGSAATGMRPTLVVAVLMAALLVPLARAAPH